MWRLDSASSRRTKAKHLATCSGCAEQLKSMSATMALLDEWQTPEPSPYFDVRLQARLREEMAKPQAGWLHWFRRPVLAAALTVMMGVGWACCLRAAAGIYIKPGRYRFLDPRARVQRSAICRRWRRITICIRISNCWMIWICSRTWSRLRRILTRNGT